jgi:hypothetical protein
MEGKALPDKMMCDAGGHQIDGRWWPEQKQAHVGRPAWTPVGRGAGGKASLDAGGPGLRWPGSPVERPERRCTGAPVGRLAWTSVGRGARGRGQRSQGTTEAGIPTREYYFKWIGTLL